MQFPRYSWLIMAVPLLVFSGWAILDVPDAAPAADTSPGAIPSPAPAAVMAASDHEYVPAKRIEPDLYRAFADWATRYQAQRVAGPTSLLLAEGLALAKARRAALKELIRTDPESALQQRLPHGIRQQLPPSIRDLLEEPINAVGSYEVTIACGFGEEGHVDATEMMVDLGGRRLRAYPYGRRLDVTTKQQMSIIGLALDDLLALSDRPVRVVQPDEVRARGLASAPVVVEALGEIRALASTEELTALEASLMAEEDSLGPEPKAGRGSSSTPELYSTFTEGPKTLLYIVCDFTNLLGYSVSTATLSNAMNAVTQYYDEVSYRKTQLVPTYVPGVLHLPKGGEAYTNAFSTLLSDARAAALAAGYNTADYDHYLVLTDEDGASINFSYAGKANIGAKGCHLVDPYYTLRTAGHELGHNYGLRHANSWRTDSDVPTGQDSWEGGYVGATNNAEWTEYGHRFSVMSGQSTVEMGDRTGHFTPAEKRRLDWLTTNEVAVVTNSQTVRLYRYDHQDATNRPQAVQINRTSTDYSGNSRQFWLGYRRAISTNAWLAHGLQVDWMKSTYGSDGSIQLDMTPYSNDDNTGESYTDDNADKYDGALLIGRTGSDPLAGIYVTPIARGGTSPDEWIDVVINLGTFPTNLAPSLALAASATNAATGASLVFTATATDANGDSLAYEWDFGLPRLLFSNSLNRAQVTNTWSTAGEYVVRCVASDMKGGRTSTSLVVRIGSPSVYRIGGRVRFDGQGVENARVYTSYTNMTYTDSSGYYQLVNLPAGSFTVRAQRYGFALTPAFDNPVGSSPSTFAKDFGLTGTPAVVLDTWDGNLRVVEGGSNDAYVVRLAARPTNSVSIHLAGDTNQLDLSSISLVLAPNDWLTGQMVTVSAVDDAVLESATQQVTILHTSTSLDPAYHALAPVTARVQVVDNDVNLAPVVSLDEPLNGSTQVQGTVVSVSITASDGDGSVTQVTLTAESGTMAVWTAPPYTTAFTGLTVGTHTWRALAWDNIGAAATSAVVNVDILADLDGDGTPDLTDEDDDGDGLTDLFEEQHFGGTTNGAPELDADEDGFSNYSEQIADTDPTNAMSFFHILAQPTGGPDSLTVQSVPGRLYTLQVCADLSALNTWSNVTGAIDVPGTGAPLTLSDPVREAGRWYRLTVTTP